MKRLYARVAPTCGRTGGKPVRLSDTKVGPLYYTRELGNLFGKENVLAMWHRGHGELSSATEQKTVVNPEENQVTVKVKYLNEEERKPYLVTVKDGALHQGGKPLTTDDAEPMWNGGAQGAYLFVMDEFGRIYAADSKKEYAARGLGDYYRACDENLYTAVTTGIPLRLWLKGAPVDHYKTIFNEAEVPCVLAMLGGKLGSSAPADQDAKWLADLGRTPYSATSVASRIVEHRDAKPGEKKRKQPPVEGTLYPEPAQPTGGSYQPSGTLTGASSMGGNYQPSGTLTGASSMGGSYQQANSLAGSPTGGSYQSAGVKTYVPDGTTLQFSSSGGASPLGSSDDESPDWSPDDPGPSLGPQDPVRRSWRKVADTGWACLKTIKPGQGIFVLTAPRTAAGAIDTAKLKTFGDDWKTIQDGYAKQWEAREEQSKTKHAARQEEKRKKHEAAQQSLPEGQRTPFVEKPFVPVPFAPQPYPGDPFEAPADSGWVCRNCYERRRSWPIMQWYQLPKDKVDPIYAEVKKASPFVLALFNRLNDKLQFTKPQWRALLPYSAVKAPKSIEVFHHSSFLAGAPVAAAGEIAVSGGHVSKINNQSGHYLPPGFYLEQVGKQLELEGVRLPSGAISYDGSADKDARIGGGHGSQNDLLSELRHTLERGVRLSRVKQPATRIVANEAIPCAGQAEPGKACPATSATTDFMDHVEGTGFLCQACLDKLPTTTASTTGQG